MARRSPLVPLLAVVALAGLAIGGLILLGRSRPAPTPAAGLPMVVPVPPPPRQPVSVEIAAGEPAVMAVAGPDDRLISDAGIAALKSFERATGTGALLVWYHGALQVEDYAGDMRPADLVPGQGLESGLLALATGAALADGHLSGIDMPVGQVLTSWAQDPRGAITLRELLRGTSGLGTPPGDPTADAAAWALSAPLAVKAGTRFQPSPVEMQLLSLVLERATGMPLPSYLSSTLWRQLGARPGEMMLDATGRAALATCCVKATARDWLRLGLLIKDHGQVGGAAVLPPSWIDAMETPFPLARNQGFRLLLAWPHEKTGPVRAPEAWTEPDTVFLAGEGGQRLYVSRVADLVILRLAAPGAAPAGGTAGGAWDDVRLPNLVASHLTHLAQPVNPGKGLTLPPITPPRRQPSVEQKPLPPPAAH